MPDPRPLTEPAEGVPGVVTSEQALQLTVDRLGAGTGPVAVDAERASGYRYGQHAYLVQVRRREAGTFLIDPVPLPDLAPLAQVLGDTEWVLHSASQDLPCLREVNFGPGGDLFDTELAGRLLGFERVGLAAMVERLLGWQLAKEHSAVDWSTRPLSVDWLRYAALDVEVLLDLRDRLAELLEEAGKDDWARQEFAAVRDAPARPPRQDPWRRTSGISTLRSPRQLAVLRELWLAREDLARVRDIAPGRLLPDRAMVNAATELPRSTAALVALPIFSGPANRRQSGRWQGAVDRALALPRGSLPPMTVRADGPPPAKAWRHRDPVAADRLTRARAAVAERAEALQMPTENLLQPDLLRRLCWAPPPELSAQAVGQALAGLGARPWQVEQVRESVTTALLAAAADPPGQD